MGKTPYYAAKSLTVKDKCSVVCGLHITDDSQVMHIIVEPMVEALYILCNTSHIKKVVLMSPYKTIKISIITIYSTIPVDMGNVNCVGQLTVPAGTSVDKNTMSKNGWYHYYSNNKNTPYLLDFLHLFPDSDDVYDFYFAEHNRHFSISDVNLNLNLNVSLNTKPRTRAKARVSAEMLCPVKQTLWTGGNGQDMRDFRTVQFGKERICHFFS